MKLEFRKKEYVKRITVKGRFYVVLGLFNTYNGKSTEWGFIEPNMFEKYTDACKFRKSLLEKLLKNSYYWRKDKIKIFKTL